MMRGVIVGMLLLFSGQAWAGALDLLSPRALDYIRGRAQETRAGYTISYSGTHGGAAYLPLRWSPSRLLEGGIGYHHQEGGQGGAFLFAGADLQSLYRKTLKAWLIRDWLQGPPLPPIYVHGFLNAPTGAGPWVIGQEAGILVSVGLK